MPVSEAIASTSPLKPQLHFGSGWPSSEQALHRDVHVAQLACEAGRALDHLALLDHAAAEAGARRSPRSTSGSAPRPRRAGSARRAPPRCRRCCRRPAARACASSAPRKSKLRQPGCAKFVDPRCEMTPSALAGPGVSRPDRAHARPLDRRSAAGCRRKTPTSSATAISGPSVTRLGRSKQLLDQELARGVQDGGVVLVAAVVEPHHHPRVGHDLSLPRRRRGAARARILSKTAASLLMRMHGASGDAP